MATAAPDAWQWPVAKVVEVHDGDTIKLAVSLGFEIWAHVWVRLLGVRAPELDRAEGQVARQDTMDWLAEHAADGQVVLETIRSAVPLEIRFRRSFTRYLGRISAVGDPAAELNGWLRDRGYTDQGE
jgi:endonuclease YncB( thermonuclease family)